MRKILTGGLAALTLIGTIAAATDAGAASRRGDYRRDNSGSAIAAGALGLALGAALAGNGSVYYGSPYYGSSYRPYYRDRYYDRRYYAPRSY